MRNKTLFLILFILCMFISIIIVKYNMKYSLIDFDDIVTSYSFSEFSLKDIFFREVYRGKYICSFLTRLTAFTLPNYFKIHPVIWTQSWGAVIKAILLFITCCSCAAFMYYKRGKITLPLTALLLVLFIQEKLSDSYQNNLYTSFYCFFFPFLFFFIFWFNFIKVFLEPDKFSKKDVFILLIFGFLNSLACECSVIISVCSLLFYVIISAIRKNIKELSISLFGFCINLTGGLLYFNSPAFKNELLLRGVIKGLNGYIQYWNEVHAQFIKSFMWVFTHEYAGYIVLVFILLVMLNYTIKDKEIKNKVNICVIAYLIGILLFKLSLFFALKHNSGAMYVLHIDIVWQVKFIFMSIILFELSFFKERKHLVVFLVLLFSLVNITDYILKEKYGEGIREKEYHNRYINERYLAYYAYKGSKKVYLYKPEYYQNDLNVLTILYAFVRPHAYASNYYGKSYDFEDIEFMDNYEELYKKYIENGGCEITKEELEKADFNKLLDRQYVLTCGKEKEKT